MESVWPVSKLSTESVGSRCELVSCELCSHHRCNKTVSLRRWCVLGIMDQEQMEKRMN